MSFLGFYCCEETHDHSTSYKGKHLIEAGLQLLGFTPLSSWWEVWQHAGKLGTEGAESSTSRSASSRK